jgi:hypothetical protein
MKQHIFIPDLYNAMTEKFVQTVILYVREELYVIRSLYETLHLSDLVDKGVEMLK